MKWTTAGVDAQVRGLRKEPLLDAAYYIAPKAPDTVWDTTICRCGDELRYIVGEPAQRWTPWSEMHPVPEGMDLAQAKEFVETLYRLGVKG